MKIKKNKYGFIVYSFGGYNFRNKREAVDFKKTFSEKWGNKNKILKIIYQIGIPEVVDWKNSKKENQLIYY